MKSVGWVVEYQTFEYGGFNLRNIIARSDLGPSTAAPIILGAHYDSRLFADQDREAASQPVPGANDGASGVAVLIELARVLGDSETAEPIWIVFFDAEDNGRIEGWDWILGSRYFVDNLEQTPRAAVIVDMVGDSDLQLYYEKNSDPDLRSEIWSTAQTLGYGQFIPEEKHSILDDHTPFLQAGIPAVDIIDFDYDYFHTTEDLPDKVSASSLAVVGRTLEVWLETGG
jgi:Zn-dependent M28 family amino/carboxypeptidase